MKALQNNNKPATHYIEVYKYNGSVINSGVQSISTLTMALDATNFIKGETIAIFKIRLK